MVTAELAASLPVLVLLLAVAVGTVDVAGARVRAQDAAREAARAAARSAAPPPAPGVAVQLSGSGRSVTARATVTVRLPLPFLPRVTVHEQVTAAREPAAEPP